MTGTATFAEIAAGAATGTVVSAPVVGVATEEVANAAIAGTTVLKYLTVRCLTLSNVHRATFFTLIVDESGS